MPVINKITFDKIMDSAECLNSIRSVIIALDSKGKIVFLNNYGYGILGYKKGELEGKYWFDTCLPKENIKDVKDVFNKCMLGKIEEVEQNDNPVITKNGEKKMIRWYNTLLKDDKGGIVGIISSGEDITEMKKAEEELKESEERYRIQFEEALDAIFIANAETGIIVDCNHAATELVERSKSELIGQHQSVLHPPEDIKGQFSETFKKHLGEAQGQTLETHVITKSGKLKDVAIKANLIELGGKKFLQGIFRDVTERKDIENELKKSEERYRFLVDNIDEIVLIISKTGDIIFANNKTAKTFGYSLEEIKGKSIANFLTENSIKKAMYALEQEFLGKPQPEMELETKTKTGEVKILNIAPGSIPVYEKGKMIGIQVNCNDVTERKKAEEAIRGSEERYRNIIELAPDGIITADTKGMVISCNTAFVKLTGYSKDEIVGKHFSKLPTLSVNDIPQYIKLFSSVIIGKMPDEPSEITWTRRDGTRCFGDISFSLIKKDQSIVGIQAFVRDITERKKADEVIKDSEERMRIILDSIQSGIVIIDTETHNIIDANPAAAKMIGAPKEKIVGSMCHKYICPAEKGKCPITDLGQKVDNSERMLLKANGESMPILKTVTTLMLKNRTCLLESFVDITERKKKEEELEKFGKLSVGRELKMVELKNRIKELEDLLKKHGIEG
jgi:PAS domain S-box-containing protein